MKISAIGFIATTTAWIAANLPQIETGIRLSTEVVGLGIGLTALLINIIRLRKYAANNKKNIAILAEHVGAIEKVVVTPIEKPLELKEPNQL